VGLIANPANKNPYPENNPWWGAYQHLEGKKLKRMALSEDSIRNL
jgi:hypothetical protein